MKFRGLYLFLQNEFQILQNLGVATNQKVAGSNPSSRTKMKGHPKGCPFVLGSVVRRAVPPFGISMLSGNEFRLRRGFAWCKMLVRCTRAAA